MLFALNLTYRVLISGLQRVSTRYFEALRYLANFFAVLRCSEPLYVPLRDSWFVPSSKAGDRHLGLIDKWKFQKFHKWKFQKCSCCRKLLLFYHCSSCYRFRARAIVSVVCCIVASHSCETLRELLHDPNIWKTDHRWPSSIANERPCTYSSTQKSQQSKCKDCMGKTVIFLNNNKKE